MHSQSTKTEHFQTYFTQLAEFFLVDPVLKKMLLPPDHATPLFSMRSWNSLLAKAPRPAESESPRLAITSMSPGLNLWTEVGL